MNASRPHESISELKVVLHLDYLGLNPGESLQYPPHWHEWLELLVVREGQLSIRIASSTFLLHAGESILIAANQLHSLHNLTPAEDVRYYCLIISPEFLKSCSLNLEHFTSCYFGRCEEIARLVMESFREHAQKKAYYSLAIRAKITEILTLALRLMPYPSAVPYDKPENHQISVVKEVINYINHHLHETISLDDICSHVHLSRYYASRLFKNATGQTISNYVLNQRCLQAQNLLLSGNYFIHEVAELCGFNSCTYFSTVFRKQMGFSPSALLQESLNDAKRKTLPEKGDPSAK